MPRRAAAAACVLAALVAAGSAGAMNTPNPRLAQPVVPLPGALEAPGPMLSQPVLPLPSASPSPGARALTVSLSTRRAGARHVALTIRFRTFLRCGKPMGPVVVTLPPGASVPARVAASAVRVNGARAGSVSVHGRSLTILPYAGGITCDSISEGTALVSIGAGAGLGNPVQPGSYAVRVAHGSESYRATVAIGR